MFKKIKLKEEAHLFDARMYLLKTFIAVLLAYVTKNLSLYPSRDMISLLFGMILTLEPANTTGVRSGLKQMEASIIGAIGIGILLHFFGYNMIVAAVGITFTVYVALVIDWRQAMVVAIFTAIYMTQFVQYDATGNPNELATFALRMSALGTGVLIAVMINFLFSVFGYRRIIEKRFFYLVGNLKMQIEQLQQLFMDYHPEESEQLMVMISDSFGMIDWVRALIADMQTDRRLLPFLYRQMDLTKQALIAEQLRNMTHITYDLAYQLKRRADGEQVEIGRQEVLLELAWVEERLQHLRNDYGQYFQNKVYSVKPKSVIESDLVVAQDQVIGDHFQHVIGQYRECLTRIGYDA